METALDSSSASSSRTAAYGASLSHQQQQQQQDGSSVSSQQYHANLSYRQVPSTTKMSFHALYTKHKTQKRKVWQDGRLVVQSHSVALHAADPPPGGGDPALDVCALQPSEIQALRQGRLTDLETEKFLVQVEGPWQGNSTVPAAAPPQTSTAVSAPGLQKLMQRKFRPPAAKRPPPLSLGQPPAFLQNRKRPLQPGELHRQYYGTTAPATPVGRDPTGHPAAHHPTVNPPVAQAYPRPAPCTQPALPNNASIQQQPRYQQQQQLGTGPTTTINSASAHFSSYGQSSAPMPVAPVAVAANARTYPPSLAQATAESSHFPPPPSHHHQHHPMVNATNRPPSRSLTSTTQRSSDFASNAFDPRGFYGEDGDEEEEEEEDEGQLAHDPTSTWGGDDSSTTRSAAPERFSTNTGRSPIADQEVAQKHQEKTLTTDDLLELFGGRDSTQADDSAESRRVETSVEESTDSPKPNHTDPQDALELPPLSDSSDEEDD